VEERSRIFKELHPNSLPAVPALFRMASYQERVIRDPESWRPEHDATPREQWNSLAGHLFEKWPVPPAFAGAWVAHGPLRHIERDWYCHLAAGGSLRRLPGMPLLRASAAREIPNAPCTLDVRHAVRWAQLRALRCPEELMACVLQSRMAVDFANDGIWIPLLEKFIADSGADPACFPFVADGVRFLVRQNGTRLAACCLRHPVRELIRHWRKRWTLYLQQALPECLAPKADMALESSELRARIVNSLLAVWRPMAGVCPLPIQHSGESEYWTIKELCSQRELLEEGALMRHCVADYTRRCQKENTAIFRMRRHTAGLPEEFISDASWTIRVDTAVRRIVEVKGYRNCCAHAGAVDVIRNWAAQNTLQFSGGRK
jgi:hypothetical protein